MTRAPLLYLTMADIAQAMGEAPGRQGRQKAMRWLQREDKGTGSVLVRVGRRLYTTPERLRRAFPDLWRRFSSCD